MTESILNGTRIFLIDDHQTMRMGLSLLLGKKGMQICGEAENRNQTFEQIADSRPDLALVDISLGDENGIELIIELNALGIRTIAYSMHDDALHIDSAFVAGANGYVTKREMAETLLDAIESVISNKRYISPIAAQSLANECISAKTRIHVENLSEREREIFRKTGEGETAPVIAATLGIAPSTVGSYYSRIIEKLGLNGIKEMRRQAIQFTKNN